MSNTDQTPADAAPYVLLFQKAHQKIVLLERLDEQVLQLLGKRQELQEELRSVQSQINMELEQRIKTSGEAPARLLGRDCRSSGDSQSQQPFRRRVDRSGARR